MFLGCWTEFTDTHSLKSEPNPATTLEACQDACLNNESCDGVDWNQGQSPGRQCWLIGPWTTTRQQARAGINQYVINRENCGKLAERTIRNDVVQRILRAVNCQQMTDHLNVSRVHIIMIQSLVC